MKDRSFFDGYFVSFFAVAGLLFFATAVSAAPVDGWIVYGSNAKIYLLQVSSSQHQPEEIYSGNNIEHACWSANGTHIYAVSEGGTIYRLENDGSNIKHLVNTGAGLARNPIAAYRPHNDSVLYVKGRDFYRISADDGTMTKIYTGERSYLGEIAIDNSGARMAARDNSGGNGSWESHDPMKIDIINNREKQYGFGCSPSISPDGTLLTENGTGLSSSSSSYDSPVNRTAHTYMRCHEFTWANGLNDYKYEWFSLEYPDRVKSAMFDSQRFAVNSNEWIVFMWDDRSGFGIIRVTRGDLYEGTMYYGEIYNARQSGSYSVYGECHPDFWVGTLPPPPSQSGTIEFENNGYEINETDGDISIKVLRSGGTTGSVSVEYATNDGSAGAGDDYTSRSGTFTWNDGDGDAKTITVPIIDDNDRESDEHFGVVLSNAEGAAVGQSSVVITILDDDSVIVDTERPSSPSALEATFVSRTGISLQWGQSSDNIGINGYYIYESSNLLDSSETPSYQTENLVPGTNYSFTIRAFDRAGNLSDPSDVLEVSTENDVVALPFKVNLGGGEYDDYTPDRQWSDDYTYGYTRSGNVTTISRSIDNTDDDEVYCSIRHIEVGYRIRVPNSTYQVTLLAAECWASNVNDRVYTAMINGTEASVDPVDVYKLAGNRQNYAVQITTEIEVTDSLIDIELIRGADSDYSPILAGIIIEESAPFTLTCFNDGGSYEVGREVTITWNANTSLISEARLWISPDNGVSWPEITTTEIGTNSSSWTGYSWTIPTEVDGIQIAGKECFMKVTDYDEIYSDISDKAFRVDFSSKSRNITGTTNQMPSLLSLSQSRTLKVIMPGSVDYSFRLFRPNGTLMHAYRGKGPHVMRIDLSETAKGACIADFVVDGKRIRNTVLLP
ncbi:MAG: hypothetical protein GF401_21110 [Chitinivibrionales bacterium]|nr:hypothetical protein [Chitinivibrionales bacterium]